ncbi:uncharacterized protein TNCV_3981611 [Trichonephila clavipes]|nr:uncharacterized protein TNCV_3981611 [Trichonephila clavipes]
MMANVELEIVTTIVAVLKPVKSGLEKLCSLLTAEGVISLIFGELIEQNSEFAKHMKYSVIQRINERCYVNLIGLMQYLNFGRKYEAAAVTVNIWQLPGSPKSFKDWKMMIYVVKSSSRSFCRAWDRVIIGRDDSDRLVRNLR